MAPSRITCDGAIRFWLDGLRDRPGRVYLISDSTISAVIDQLHNRRQEDDADHGYAAPHVPGPGEADEARNHYA